MADIFLFPCFLLSDLARLYNRGAPVKSSSRALQPHDAVSRSPVELVILLLPGFSRPHFWFYRQLVNDIPF